MKMLMHEFPELIKMVEIGKTYMNETIHGFVIGLNLTSDNWDKQAL